MSRHAATFTKSDTSLIGSALEPSTPQISRTITVGSHAGPGLEPGSGRLTTSVAPGYHPFSTAPLLTRVCCSCSRDPVDRFFSGLAHLRRAGLPCDGAAIADAFERGMYHRSFTRWLEHFAADQILVLQYERCAADINGQLARTFEFLRLSKYAVVFSERSARSQQSSAGREYDEDVRARLVDLYAADVTALVAQLPDINLSLWPNFSHLAGDGAPPDSVPHSISPTRRQ